MLYIPLFHPSFHVISRTKYLNPSYIEVNFWKENHIFCYSLLLRVCQIYCTFPTLGETSVMWVSFSNHILLWVRFSNTLQFRFKIHNILIPHFSLDHSPIMHILCGDTHWSLKFIYVELGCSSPAFSFVQNFTKMQINKEEDSVAIFLVFKI
jgi:hypothetical protein